MLDQKRWLDPHYSPGSSVPAPWAPGCSSSIPGTILPQDLCTVCFLCLYCPPLCYLFGWSPLPTPVTFSVPPRKDPYKNPRSFSAAKALSLSLEIWGTSPDQGEGEESESQITRPFAPSESTIPTPSAKHGWWGRRSFLPPLSHQSKPQSLLVPAVINAGHTVIA